MTENINITEVDEYEMARTGDANYDDWPFYVMIAGGMGAGKTHVVNQYIKNITIFDIDDIMEQKGFLEYSPDQFALAMNDIAEKIEAQYRNRRSMVAMGTASNATGAIDRLHAAKMRGYRTMLLHVDAPARQSFIQNKMRLENGERGVARQDQHLIERTTDASVETVALLRKSALVDYFVYYNNIRDI